MKKFYYLIAAIIIVILCANVYYGYRVYNQQLSFHEEMLLNQSQICGWEIEQSGYEFENEINYIVFSSDIASFFEDQDNIEIAEELAEAVGGVVSCSRPIVDAKWLEKSRQVGTSGQTVKPKVYMALGISGSFQHLGGLKGNPFIVAVNKNSKAPIFQVADVGVVEDLLDFVPVLTEKIQEGK